MPVVRDPLRLKYEDPFPPRRTGSINSSDLSILYLLLVHDHPDFVIHLIDAVDEPQHHFIIHVDLSSNSVHQYLLSKLSGRSNIYLMDEGRERVSWGAFSIVNATLNGMRLAFKMDIAFDFLLLASGQSYPIKSNKFIRESLAKNPNAVYMDIIPEPSNPDDHLWHHFVECDGALHRVARLTYIKGINMFISSQWFAAPRHVIQWMVENPLPKAYAEYAQYIIIADENFFATMFMNSPYCSDEAVRTLIFLLFDRWENEKTDKNGKSLRDERKCLNPDKNNCGRSPSVLTMEFKHLIASSRALFARKFDPTEPDSVALVDFIDQRRGSRRYYNGSDVTRSSETAQEQVDAWDNNKESGGKVTMIRVGFSKEMQIVMAEDMAEAAAQSSTSGNSTSPSASTASSASKTISTNSTNNTQSLLHNEELLKSILASNLSVNGSTGMERWDGKKVTKLQRGLCFQLVEGDFIVADKCDPLNSNQWFKIGA